MPELKYFDLGNLIPCASNASTNAPQTVSGWQIEYLFFPTQGADITNRIGRKTIIDKILLRYMLANGQSATSIYGAGFVRILVVYDQQNNSLNSSATNIAGALLTQPADINSSLLLDNRERFLVLMDKYIYLGGSTTTAAGLPSVATDHDQAYRLKFKQRMLKDVIFNGTNGGTNADVVTGSVFTLIGTNKISNDATGFGPRVHLYSRVRWHDC